MPEERRVVTVLFADVAGSTALADASDPEDVRELMAAYYEIAGRAIAERGGTLEKFIGDAVMAVFGVPQAHDDDPDRALAAAVALRDAVASDPATARLGLRIGVNTGEVIAARDPGRDFLVTGDAVNVAARLQQAAAPGEIVVGTRTIAAAGPRFRFSALRALELKGKPEPVGCAVLEAIVEGGPARRSAGPFVGRGSDLAQLGLAAQRAFDESRPQLVTISAPAGTGKSRLVEEFERRIRAGRPALRVTVAQCLPFGAAITYLPMRGLLAGLLEVAPDALSIELVAGRLRERGVDIAESERVATLVGATLGLHTEIGPRDREEFFAAWRAAVEGLAAGETTMLVLEDLHWASDSLLDLIEHVVQPRTRAPLLMVALTRPELFDRRATWGSARRNATSIALEPLADDDTQALVDTLLPDAEAGTRTRIAERAEGNPFFAAELARSYRELGEAAQLPDTIQATMLARLDLLPDQERRVVQLGSIVGRAMHPTAVAQLLGASADHALGSLTDRDVLVPQADGSFAFRHIVIRDVAYGTLTRTERAAGHLTLARWLDGHTGSGPELVAHHYRQAILSSPRGLADRDAQAAIAALEQAAAFAKRTGAVREAIALLQDALRIAPVADQMRLNEELGDVTELTDSAVAAFAEAFRLWNELPPETRDAVTGARLLRKQLIVHVRWGGSIRELIAGPAAIAMLDRARGLLPPDERYERARLDVCEAFMGNSGNRTFRSIPIERRPTAERARALSEAARLEFAERGDRLAQAEALDQLGMLAQQAQEYDRAVAVARQRMALGDLGLLERGDATAMVCWALLLKGDHSAVITTFDEYVAGLRPGEPEGFYPYPHALAATAARTGGRWHDATRIADRVARSWDEEQRGQRPPVAAQGFTAAAYVARASLDQPRFQRYAAITKQLLEGIAADVSLVLIGQAVFEEDPASALRMLEGLPSNPFFVGDAITLLLFDHDLCVPESLVLQLEAVVVPRAALFEERVRLVRAVRAGPDAIRASIASLERAGIHGDTARAAGVLARVTGDAVDRADAERRLKAMGDLAYLARLDEPFRLRES